MKTFREYLEENKGKKFFPVSKSKKYSGDNVFLYKGGLVKFKFAAASRVSDQKTLFTGVVIDTGRPMSHAPNVTIKLLDGHQNLTDDDMEKLKYLGRFDKKHKTSDEDIIVSVYYETKGKYRQEIKNVKTTKMI